MEELFAEERDAIELLNKEENAIFTLRCYLSTSNLIKEATKTLKKNTYLISSNEKNRLKTNEKFQVEINGNFYNTTIIKEPLYDPRGIKMRS